MGRNRFCDEKLQGAALQDTKLRAARTQMHGRGQVNSDSRSRHAALNQAPNEVTMRVATQHCIALRMMA